MPLHIEDIVNEVTVVDGELPLTEAQVDRLVAVVLKRLEGKQREARKREEATRLSGSAVPAAGGGE